MRSGRQLVRRTKMEGGPDGSAVFSFGRIARHPAVNPGRGDKHGDELGDATGSLVLIVRLLLVRVTLPPCPPICASLLSPAPSSAFRSVVDRSSSSLFLAAVLPLCHSLVASSFRGSASLSFSLLSRQWSSSLPHSLLNCVLPGARAQATLSMAGIKRLLPFPLPPRPPPARSLRCSLPAVTAPTEPPPSSFYPASDVLALTWISYPVAFDNGTSAASSSFVFTDETGGGCRPPLKNEVIRVPRLR